MSMENKWFWCPVVIKAVIVPYAPAISLVTLALDTQVTTYNLKYIEKEG